MSAAFKAHNQNSLIRSEHHQTFYYIGAEPNKNRFLFQWNQFNFAHFWPPIKWLVLTFFLPFSTLHNRYLGFFLLLLDEFLSDNSVTTAPKWKRFNGFHVEFKSTSTISGEWVIERWSHFVFKWPDVRYRAVGTSSNITLGSVIITFSWWILPTSREASPISKDHQWQLLFIEVTDGLGSFIGRVWVPHLTCLGYDLKRIGINIKLGRKLAPHQSILRKALIAFPLLYKIPQQVSWLRFEGQIGALSR